MRLLAALLLALPFTATPVDAAYTCATPTRLYDGTGFAGDALVVGSRWIVFNLNGLDNRVSSVRVGSCPVDLWTGLNGSGAVLSLWPGQWVASMPAGWNNVASSGYLY